MSPAWFPMDIQLGGNRDHCDIPYIKEKQELSNCLSVKCTNIASLWGHLRAGRTLVKTS